jgi:hypothetical protein
MVVEAARWLGQSATDRNSPLYSLVSCGLKEKRYMTREDTKSQTATLLRTGRQTADRNKHQTLRRFLRGEK